MPTIDKLLEKMEQRNVQQIVIVNDQKMQLFSNGHAADGPHVSLQQLREILNESVPPSILARLSKGGHCRFPYPSPQGVFNITCERRNEALKVSIVVASPSKRPQTYASTGLSIPSPMPATMPPLAPTGQGSAASANSQRWFGSAGAIGLLVVGGLIGAAIVVPSFVSSSNPASHKVSPPTAVPAPSTQTPAVTPSTPAPPIVSPSQPKTAQRQPTTPQPAVAPVTLQQASPPSDASDYQLPTSKTDSVPQIIADISADIEAANTPERASQIAFACNRIEGALRDKARNDPRDVDISSNWAMAMGHLTAAAKAKSALLSNPPSYDVQRLTMNLNAGLFNAKNSGQAAQQFIDEKHNPQLAHQNRERFRQRAEDYGRYNRDIANGSGG